MKKMMKVAAAAVVVGGVAVSAQAFDMKFGGAIRGTLDYQTVKQDGQKVDPSGIGYALKDGLLRGDFTFNKMWSFTAATDVDGSTGAANNRFYFKRLYLQANLFPDQYAVQVRLGEDANPWINESYNLYTMGTYEDSLVDRTNFGNSADWGVHVLHAEGAVDSNYWADRISWNAALTTGQGYHVLNRSRTLNFEAMGAARLLDGLRLAVGMAAGKSGQLVYNGPQRPSPKTGMRYDIGLSYASNKFGLNVGGEYFYATNWYNAGDCVINQNTNSTCNADHTPVQAQINGVSSTAYNTKADGFSVYASYDLGKLGKLLDTKLLRSYTLFARYDSLRPIKSGVDYQGQALQGPMPKETYYNVGVEYLTNYLQNDSLVVKYGLTYKYIQTKNGYVSETNGLIGGQDKGSYSQIALWLRAGFNGV